jgi:lipopolysaccharide/colanic/teichoic acid biosynthesis glycosyltransferase
MVYLFLKRMFDIVVSFTGLLVLLPFFLIIMLILKCTGEGEVFYRQERVGLNNRKFIIYKFTTMRKNSERQGGITYSGDPRVLPVGRFLRKTKINELPQLLNMLKGDISIVGPRPLMEDGFAQYPVEIKNNIYKDNKPGLTGLGSLFFRDEERFLSQQPEQAKHIYAHMIMPVKGRLELWYKNNKGFRVDLKIIVLTAVSIFFPRNNFHLSSFKGMDSQIIEDYRHLLA